MEKDNHFLDTIWIVPWNTYLMFVNLKGNFFCESRSSAYNNTKDIQTLHNTTLIVIFSFLKYFSVPRERPWWCWWRLQLTEWLNKNIEGILINSNFIDLKNYLFSQTSYI